MTPLKILAYPQVRLAETGKKEKKRKANSKQTNKQTKTKQKTLAETERTIFSQFHLRS